MKNTEHKLFEVQARDPASDARAGLLSLPHGELETPVFMPVGTQGSVKTLRSEDVDALGFKIILANTYHLYLRPGMDVIRAHGTLHDFSRWQHNILTDSGGFQVFSLAPFRKITKEGVHFQSHIDGSRHLLTPEKVVRIQECLGSDIQMVLDVCTEPGISKEEAAQALEITSAWARRAKEEWLACEDSYQGRLFGIVQGNFFKDLRQESAGQVLELDLPGYAIGGLSVGEAPEVFREFLFHTAALLPEGKPKYLMGIGTPDYILEAIEAGIDMFDCVFPTRVARNGYLFSETGKINIKNEKYRLCTQTLDPASPISGYTLGYLRHLFKAGEILGPVLATTHNLWFLKTLVDRARISIREARFAEFKKDFLSRYYGDRD